MNARLASAASGGSRARRFGSSPGHFLSGFVSSGYDTGFDAVCKSTLLVAVVMLLLACGITYLLVARWGSKPPVTVRRCDGLACDDPYEALRSLLNDTVKPCDNIYQHVCSRWTWNQEHSGFLQESLDNYLVQMHAIFETPGANASGAGLADGLRAGGGLYSQCLAAMERRKLTLEEDMLFFVHKFLVSRIIGSETPLNAMKAGSETSFTFGLNGFLTLRPQRLDADAVMYAFKGNALRTSFPAMADLQLYVRVVLEAARLARRSPSIATAVVALDSIVVAHKHRQDSAHKKIPAANLQQESQTLWSLTDGPMKRLTAMSSLSRGFLLVRDYENTLALISFFESASRVDVSWYLVVQMLADLLIFDYMTRFELNDKWHVMRACSGAVNKAVTHVWASLSRQLILNKASGDYVSDIFEVIKSTLASSESYFINFVDNVTFSRIQKTLGDISFVSNGKLLEIQRNLMLEIGSLSPAEKFIRNYVAIRHQMRSQSLIWPPNVFWDIASLLEMEARPSYRGETDSLYLSTALQIPHVSYWEEPERLLNYGTIGALLARELVKSVSPDARLKQGEALWSEEATRSFLKSMACYVGGSVVGRVGNATDFKLELFLWLTSARVAYDALRNDFSGSVHKSQSWTAMQKLFFLRFCLAACESTTATAVSASHKCTWPLAENPAFVEAFNCPQGSFMSSHPKCNA